MSLRLRLRLPRLGFVGLLGAAACTSASGSPEAIEVADSSGTSIVANRGPVWDGNEGWEVASTPELVVGRFGGPEEYQLVEVSGVAVDSDGDLIVADAGSRAVRLYDRQGRFLRTLGSPGSGPGEFESPGAVQVIPGDSVLVWDEAALRTTLFDPAGDLVEVRTLDLASVVDAMGPPLYPGHFLPLPTGDYLVLLMEKALDKAKGSPDDLSRPRSGALRLGENPLRLDTLMLFGGEEQVVVDAPFGRYPVSPPLARRPVVAAGGEPHRICIGTQTTPEIDCFGPGDRSTKIRWQAEPSPPSGRDLELWREQNLRYFGPKFREDQILRMLDQVPVPRFRPPYSEIHLDALGFLWALEGESSEVEPPSFIYLVFDPEGRFLGRVGLPDVEVMAIGKDYVVGIHRDELEIQYLHRYRLSRG